MFVEWHKTFINLLFLQSFLVNFAVASHIVGLPNLNFVSHSRGLWKIGKELASRGHKYTQLLPDCAKEKSLPDVDVVIFNTSITGERIEKLMNSVVKAGDIGSVTGMLNLWNLFGENKNVTETFCEDLLLNRKLMAQLKETVDLVLCDLSLSCCPVFAEILGVPQVMLMTTAFVDLMMPGLLELPQPLIHMNLWMGKSGTASDRFSFTNRLKNTFAYFAGHITISLSGMLSPSDIWEKHAKSISKYSSAVEAHWKRRGIILVSHDFAFTYHQPLYANVKIIGPLLPGPARPLPADLDGFMSINKKVVIVSFGTVFSQYRTELVDNLAVGLSMLPVQVLWKHSAIQPAGVGNNTKIVPWIPQNDILGHQSTAVFLTHGGLNSFQESVYHGVPVVVLPLSGDQYWSADVCVDKKIGVTLDKDNLIPEIIVEAVNEVLNNKVYKQNVIKISKVLKSRKRTPAEEGADWIEYAMDNDGALHLRSPAGDLPFYQLHMLDVFLFISFAFLLFVFSFVRLCKCVCCRKKEQLKEKEKTS